MTSQRQTRQQITDFLATNGPIDDPTGRATAKLRAGIDYQGSGSAFTQLLAAMERSGELIRTTKGKRTFQISATTREGAGSLSEPIDRVTEEFDYDELAASLLLRAVDAITSGGREKADTDSWARRRIDRLERQSAELERALSRAKAESRALTEERDLLKQQLEHTAGNLALLTDRLQSRPAREPLSERLGSDDRALLHQLRGGKSGNRSNRVG